MVKALSTLFVSALLVVNACANLIAGRQAAVTDKQCGSLMCVSATVNGSNVEYVLSSLGKRPLGWMGMGFGRVMASSPMVIMWANDGKVVLSQRSAPREVMPTVDPNPPRIATLVDSLTSLTGDTSSFGYSIPANGDTQQWIIFAYGTQAPGSSAIDAVITQHYEFRTVQLDLSGGSSPTSSGSGSSPTQQPSNPSHDIPFLPYQRMIIAHAIFCVVGFLLLLPAGALLARYLRTFTPTWFTGHWLAQFAVAGPTIIAGVALGIQSVSKAGAFHLNDDHKKLGTALFVLYFVQVVLGAVIHWVKPQDRTRRPIQNYGHAVLGLLIIALAMYQVHLGFTEEWAKTTGREPLPNGVYILFWLWIAFITVLYFAGLTFLPKQFRQESQPQRLPISDSVEEYRD
ncbi:putative protein with possible catecholamine-binding domain present in a variety of eukaryotic proteins [Lyophyllum shimeji]|uniref:Cytochrome b561 domain-containing protein n=1 Tax=Lyophyllum shimeji TaxID=47721 RepID=A0A9P3PKP0_LYOSH|nr:putative protein with possible catecholamine-binding domain present in a variety of eukaryotic proteins [Lyophyllum shimeji]